MALKNWSTTATSNATVDSINWAENQAPSTVNDSSRALMADVRTWYNDIEWRDWGHTVTYASATTFTVPTDVTSIYIVDQPIRCADATTLYGKVASRTYSAPNTTVTVTLDSGSLSASLTAVALGQKPTGKPIDVSGVRGAAGLADANVFTVNQSINNINPGLRLYETDAAVDNRLWEIIAYSEAFHIQVINDAGTVGVDAVIVQRTGTTIDSVTIGGTTVAVTNNLTVGKLTGGIVPLDRLRKATASNNSATVVNILATLVANANVGDVLIIAYQAVATRNAADFAYLLTLGSQGTAVFQHAGLSDAFGARYSFEGNAVYGANSVVDSTTAFLVCTTAGTVTAAGATSVTLYGTAAISQASRVYAELWSGA